MSQNIINYGATPNDGEGDQLRTAFIKTEDNFDQLWAAGPVGSNIKITGGNIVVQNTNGNLTLSPNGTGKVITNTILPRGNNIYNLGSADFRYRKLWVGTDGADIIGNLVVGGTITANQFNIQELTGNVYFNETLGVAGSASVGGNIIAGNIQSLATVSAVGTITSGNLSTPGYVSAAGNVTGGNIITGGQIYAAGNVTANNLSLTGSLTASKTLITANIEPYVIFKSGVTEITEYDYTAGSIFYQADITDVITTANIINFTLATGSTTTLRFYFVQGVSGITSGVPTIWQINGATQTIKWLNDVVPTPHQNKTDIIDIDIINNAGTYIIYGKVDNYG